MDVWIVCAKDDVIIFFHDALGYMIDHFLLFYIRLQDLTDRDLEKQEREKSLNSLEAFVFETQVYLVALN